MKLLEVKNLRFGYDGAPVLDQFSMSAREKEIVLIDGENGAGKTTLLKCITNVLNNGESIFIKEKSVQEDKSVLRDVSFIMSDDTLYDYLTLRENIAFFKSLFGEDDSFITKVDALCVEFGITKYENYLIKSLSQGTRHKLYLAIMFSKRYNILILDEPFTALDKGTQTRVIEKMEAIAQQPGKCVLMVTHVSEFKKIATRTIALHKLAH